MGSEWDYLASMSALIKVRSGGILCSCEDFVRVPTLWELLQDSETSKSGNDF